MDFLHDDTVKLFRSTTEGNILVKLTNINFTPNQQLGRLIYNFSATATEIAEPSFNNYKDYGVISTGDISSIVNNIKELFKNDIELISHDNYYLSNDDKTMILNPVGYEELNDE